MQGMMSSDGAAEALKEWGEGGGGGGGVVKG